MVTTFVSSFCSKWFAGEDAVGVLGMVGKEVEEMLSAPVDCFRVKPGVRGSGGCVEDCSMVRLSATASCPELGPRDLNLDRGGRIKFPRNR